MCFLLCFQGCYMTWSHDAFLLCEDHRDIQRLWYIMVWQQEYTILSISWSTHHFFNQEVHRYRIVFSYSRFSSLWWWCWHPLFHCASYLTIHSRNRDQTINILIAKEPKQFGKRITEESSTMVNINAPIGMNKHVSIWTIVSMSLMMEVKEYGSNLKTTVKE